MGVERSSLIIAILLPFYRHYQHAIKKKYPGFYVYIYTGSTGAWRRKRRVKAISQCKDFLPPFIASTHFYRYHPDARTEPLCEYPKDRYLESHRKYVLFSTSLLFTALESETPSKPYKRRKKKNQKPKQRSKEDPKLKKPLKSAPFPCPFTPAAQSSRAASLAISSGLMSRMRGR